MFNFNIKDNFRRLVEVLSEPKTLAVIQVVGAAVTLLHAGNKLRNLLKGETEDWSDVGDP